MDKTGQFTCYLSRSLALCDKEGDAERVIKVTISVMILSELFIFQITLKWRVDSSELQHTTVHQPPTSILDLQVLKNL